MAIVAQPANGINVDIQLQDPLNNGQILIYDANIGLFVNKKPTGTGGAVIDGENVGGINAVGVFKQKNSDSVLEFFNLYPGSGISIVQDVNDNLVFSTDTSEATVSVSDDYTIIIDNDNNNPSAVFRVGRVDPTGTISIDISVLAPLSANNIFTGNVSGRGFIQSQSDLDFVALGYIPDMIIGLSGTVMQDGYYLIDDVVNVSSNSTIYFKEEFTGDAAFNLGGPNLPIEIIQASIWVPDNDGDLGPDYSLDRLYSLQFWGVDLGPLGYDLQPGMIVTLVGSENGLIDGTYEIDTVFPENSIPIVAWSGLQFKYTTPLADGLTQGVVLDADLVTNELNITVNSEIADTGFTVNKIGEVTATKVFVTAAPTTDYELTNKEYVDAQINGLVGVSAFTAIVSSQAAAIADLTDRVEDLETRSNRALRMYRRYARF